MLFQEHTLLLEEAHEALGVLVLVRNRLIVAKVREVLLSIVLVSSLFEHLCILFGEAL